MFKALLHRVLIKKGIKMAKKKATKKSDGRKPSKKNKTSKVKKLIKLAKSGKLGKKKKKKR